MKLIVDVANYKIESCKRRKEEGINEWYHNMILDGVPLEDELEKIKEELQDEKESYISAVGKCGFTEGITFAIETIDEYIGDL